MNVAIMCMESVDVGEIVVMKFDNDWNRVTVRTIGGEFVGVVSKIQPDGCISLFDVTNMICDNIVLLRVSMRMGEYIILHSDTQIFNHISRQKVWVGSNSMGIGE